MTDTHQAQSPETAEALVDGADLAAEIVARVQATLASVLEGNQKAIDEAVSKAVTALASAPKERSRAPIAPPAPLEQDEQLLDGETAQINELVGALALAQGQYKPAKRTAKNPFYDSKYAPLDSVIDACREALSSNGLAVVQRTFIREVGFDEYGRRVGKQYLRTKLLHASGQNMWSVYPIAPMKQEKGQGWVPAIDPQAFASTNTYARRAAYMAIVGIAPSDEDDDGNAGSGVDDDRPRNGNGKANGNGHGKEPSLDDTPCPKCGLKGALRPSDYGGFFCWKKLDGCGDKFADDPRQQPSLLPEAPANDALEENLRKMREKAPPGPVGVQPTKADVIEALDIVKPLEGLTSVKALAAEMQRIAATDDYKSRGRGVRAAAAARYTELRALAEGKGGSQ